MVEEENAPLKYSSMHPEQHFKRGKIQSQNPVNRRTPSIQITLWTNVNHVRPRSLHNEPGAFARPAFEEADSQSM